MGFPPESEEGNVEYKLTFGSTDIDRLAGQLKRRLSEGGGEAIYLVGVSNDGRPLGLPDDELVKALGVLREVAKRAGASLHILRISEGIRGKVAEVLLRVATREEPPPTVTVVVLGNVDAGKSTLVGVLTTGKLDDGKGSARAYASRYKHEVLTGRTSAVSMRLLGFRADSAVNHQLIDPLDEAEVYRRSDKLVLLVDVGGHERYLRTALRGLFSSQPDYVMLVAAANSGVQKMTKEHLGIAVALGVPVFIVITRVDIAPQEVFQRTLEDVVKVVKMPGVSKIPYVVRDLGDVVLAAKAMPAGRVAPIFFVSNVTGHGLDLLLRFLSILPRRRKWDYGGDFLMYISDIYLVRGVGVVVGGLVERGVARVGDRVWVGPYGDGNWISATIKSIHINRTPVESAGAGSFITVSLDRVDKVEKGMVLSSKPLGAAREVVADVLVLRHPTVIRAGFSGVFHYKAVRTSAYIREIDKGELMVGDSGIVKIELARPWHIDGGVFVFRNGPTRIFGRVLRVGDGASAS
ncbi:GTP-binding protein [Pyrobaculum neutrophilum]|uniref:Protein synthesis factor GTP-binding n=1 Tax=Pyrobaculum neutrophilum (strain DSM 2338 / JCM 9278 / NBRC 100436 / V24Sta) TaxID=444157 RepID=B1YD17_PYRNV|nr:GTP-binding protein [Pyrobaculum neutrophilum]ACB39680.1 protein synthesis factor GTP-binding [Pyrobaculum neutrophilum V24Sta]